MGKGCAGRFVMRSGSNDAVPLSFDHSWNDSCGGDEIQGNESEAFGFT